MKIGIIGTGRMGREFAKLWQMLGHDIMLGSRSAPTDLSVDVEVGSIAKTADFGDIIVLAVPW